MMTMDDNLFLDTNVLVYASSVSSEFYEETCKRLAKYRKTHKLLISRQILREYAVVMSRPGTLEVPLTPVEVVKSIHKWQETCIILDEAEQITEEWLKLIEKYNIKGKRIHDTNIVPTMLANDIPTIFTLNRKDFEQFDGINLAS